MRLGIFGGSFDPVHYGHLLLAETCREQCRLDRVWFQPAAVPPHKQESPLTAAEHRLTMLDLAIGGHEPFEVSRREIDRGGVSYTYQTLEAIRDEQPEAELFFLMGGDSLRDLPTWRKPERICELAVPVVVHRHDAPPVDFDAIAGLVTPGRLEEIRACQVEMPIVEYSSTDIRARVAAGRSIRFHTPRAVQMYIQEQGLYREGGDRSQESGDRGRG